jgi:hypothetical protein
MGLFNTLFRSDSSSEGSVRVRQSKEDSSKITADTFIHHGGSSHEHRSFNLDTSSGKYKEYYGGEKGSHRSS